MTKDQQDFVSRSGFAPVGFSPERLKTLKADIAHCVDRYDYRYESPESVAEEIIELITDEFKGKR